MIVLVREGANFLRRSASAAAVNATAAGRWLTKTDESQVSGVEASSAAASAISLKAGDTL